MANDHDPASLSAATIGSVISHRRQELIILPTEKCNFRCTYCYEDFLLGRMSESTQLSIERYLDKRTEDVEQLTISWFGGEPLLAKEVVLRISRYAKRLSTERGFRLKGGFTTNGYLLDPNLVEELVSLNQAFFQISLDGWGDVHDQTRRLANGQGTFERIWGRLLALQKTDLKFDILLRLHMTAKNYASLEVLCQNIYKYFGQDRRFRLDFQDIKDLGGTSVSAVERNSSSSYLSRAHKLNSLAEGRELQGNSGAQSPVSSDQGRAPASESARFGEERSEPYICYAAKPNSLLIRSNGRLGKCTVALNDPRNDIGRLLPDGEVEIFAPKMREWIRGLATLDVRELSCPLDNLSREEIDSDAAVAEVKGQRLEISLIN